MHLRTLTTLYEALKTILALLHSIAQYYYKIRNSILLFNEDFFSGLFNDRQSGQVLLKPKPLQGNLLAI